MRFSPPGKIGQAHPTSSSHQRNIARLSPPLLMRALQRRVARNLQKHRPTFNINQTNHQSPITSEYQLVRSIPVGFGHSPRASAAIDPSENKGESTGNSSVPRLLVFVSSLHMPSHQTPNPESPARHNGRSSPAACRCPATWHRCREASEVPRLHAGACPRLGRQERPELRI
jgi:hypothetical protein